MSILIKGMEMPKEIEPALVIDFCEDLDGRRYARFYHYRYGGLTDWHEILELHEPHGRLIDADALIAAHEQVCSRSMKFNLDLALTIIPADVPDNNVGNISAEDGEQWQPLR